MQRLMKNVAIVLAAAYLYAQVLDADVGALRLHIPISFLLSKNEVNSVRLDLGSGFLIDYFFLKWGKWRFGPGISLYGTLPVAAGNAMVSIRPYSLLTELRCGGVFDLFKKEHGLSLSLTAGSELGSLIVKKNVQNSHKTTADFLFGAHGRVGLTYWLHEVGIGTSYGISINTILVRHRFDVSLHLALLLPSAS